MERNQAAKAVSSSVPGSEAQDGLGGVFFTRSETTTVHLKQEDPNKKAGALVAIDKKDGATERADG